MKRLSRSDAMTKRPNQIFERSFYWLLDQCKPLMPEYRFRFKNPLISMDATIIDLGLSVFPWAEFRQCKGAVKQHSLDDHISASLASQRNHCRNTGRLHYIYPSIRFFIRNP